jgi:RNA polymerase sigma factor (sigma-70 family)
MKSYNLSDKCCFSHCVSLALTTASTIIAKLLSSIECNRNWRRESVTRNCSYQYKAMMRKEQKAAMGKTFSDEDEQRRTLMEAIFREHFGAVHRYISNKVRQLDVADDLTSMVFLKAFRWLGEDRGVKQVRKWLYATARTTIADYWREQQKRLYLPLESIENSSVVLLETQDDEQSQERIYHLLHLLPERERQVLLLRYFQGYNAAEVGHELGLNVGHVRVLQLRALRRAALLDAKERSLVPMQEPTNEPVTIYTEQGQRVLNLAKEEAQSFHHNYIGTEHLLLGILHEGSAALPLTSQGATLVRAQAELLSVVGKNEPGTRTDTPFTPRSQRILEIASEIASKQGEAAISPEHILQAVIHEKQGLAIHMLRSMEVNLDYWLATEEKSSPEKNEQYIQNIEQRIAQNPQLDEKEERRLAHLIARATLEQRRAELLKETPDPHIIEEGEIAYSLLIPASQHLVLSVAKEYFEPERDAREIVAAGNGGLSVAAISFGLMKQTTFRSYAAHMIHLQIIQALE